ncbi:MAG TPA: hypothetical protein DIT07_16725, partial [Sphingobacteriaceae bacterium]|nr:hypothetical protein [Sphingobacteriaceae bacterium]
QYYTSEKYGGKISMFKAQANWIVTNKDALNVKYIVQLGDCAEDGDNAGNPIQWMRADTAVAIIENPVTTHLPHG